MQEIYGRRMPVAHFLKCRRIREGFVQFQLNDRVPDCYLWGTDGKPRGVEVTIAQGRARYHLANELVKNGTGRGFTELQDDDSAENFVKTFQEEPAGYTTDIALASTTKAIRLCLSKKNDGKYDGMDLLIQGPLNVMTLPRERWTAIKDDLIAAAKDMPFREIYVIGDSSRRPICFQIKRGNR